MKRYEPTKLPHHYPVNISLKIAPNWIFALQEFRELAAESRRRAAARQITTPAIEPHVQSNQTKIHLHRSLPDSAIQTSKGR